MLNYQRVDCMFRSLSIFSLKQTCMFHGFSPMFPMCFLRFSGWWLSPTPLKNMSSSVGMMKFPYIMEKKKCLKPPTSHSTHFHSVALSKADISTVSCLLDGHSEGQWWTVRPCFLALKWLIWLEWSSQFEDLSWSFFLCVVNRMKFKWLRVIRDCNVNVAL